MKNIFKNILLVLCPLFLMQFMACGTGEDFGLSSKELPESLGLGWNLGNTLDATGRSGLSCETSWGMPYTTEEMIKAVAEKGFTSIRIPVSYHDHIVDKENHVIDEEWLNRVKQIVDWSLKYNLKVITNIHHDNLKASEMESKFGYCISDNANLQKKSKEYIKNVWLQVAEKFKYYDTDSLIFETLNEPRTVGESTEWWVSDVSLLSKFNRIIVDYEQTALDAIRSTGEKNAERYVMHPPYAANPNAFAGWSLPKDSADNRQLVSIHAYTPSNFALAGTVTKYDATFASSIEGIYSTVDNMFLKKGIGVVMGEASASDKNNLSERTKWAKTFFKASSRRKIPVMLWDNMVTAEGKSQTVIDEGECHGYLNRRNCTWYFPALVNTMLSFY